MKNLVKKYLVPSTLAALAISSISAHAANEVGVQIDGSSTVFPISEAMAEEFQAATGTRVTVGLSGTGGGFKKFCRGEIDVSNASRPIKKEEIEACKAEGIEYIELPIAMDALANIVNPANTWADCMTVEELKKMWEPAAQAKVNNWNQINPKFPNAPLKLFGAGTDSGTYDYYTAAIVGTEHESRGDYTATEDDNITIQGVSTDKNALGFLGLAYAHENKDKVKTIAIKQADGSCVSPSVATARDASYQPLSRPLFMYFNKKYLDQKPAVSKFAYFVMDPKNGEALVEEVGYVPLPDQAFVMGKAKLDKRTTGSVFDGASKIGVKIEDLFK